MLLKNQEIQQNIGETIMYLLSMVEKKKSIVEYATAGKSSRLLCERIQHR